MFAALGAVFQRHVSLRDAVMRIRQILRIHGQKGLILDERLGRAVRAGEAIAEIAMHLGAQGCDHQHVLEDADRVVGAAGLAELTRERDQRIGIVAAGRRIVRTTRPELAARTKQGYFGPVN